MLRAFTVGRSAPEFWLKQSALVFAIPRKSESFAFPDTRDLPRVT